MSSLSIAPQAPEKIPSGSVDKSIEPPGKHSALAATVTPKTELTPGSGPTQLARLPWEAKVVTASPAGRSKEQIGRDFAGIRANNPWGTVVAESSTQEFKNSPHLREAHGTLPLPNLKDDKKTILNGTYKQRPIDNSIQNLRDLKGVAYRAAVAGHFVSPEASRSMRHYLEATGKPLERVVGRNFWDTGQYSENMDVNKYVGQLEKSALRYAIDHPNATEFTIQGPLISLRHNNSSDLEHAMGSFFAGARAHYKIDRSLDGRITLDGQTQMFGIDFYDFKHYGVAMPAAPGEKVSKVEQHYLQAMTLVKYNGEYLAKPFEQTFLEPPHRSYITNKP